MLHPAGCITWQFLFKGLIETQAAAQIFQTQMRAFITIFPKVVQSLFWVFFVVALVFKILLCKVLCKVVVDGTLPCKDKSNA